MIPHLVALFAREAGKGTTMVTKQSALLSTGVTGLDQVLGGGLTPNRLYLAQGDPGVGKTTLALQFLLNGKMQAEPTMYITLSETKDELRSVAASHG